MLTRPSSWRFSRACSLPISILNRWFRSSVMTISLVTADLCRDLCREPSFHREDEWWPFLGVSHRTLVLMCGVDVDPYQLVLSLSVPTFQKPLAPTPPRNPNPKFKDPSNLCFGIVLGWSQFGVKSEDLSVCCWLRNNETISVCDVLKNWWLKVTMEIGSFEYDSPFFRTGVGTRDVCWRRPRWVWFDVSDGILFPTRDPILIITRMIGFEQNKCSA